MNQKIKQAQKETEKAMLSVIRNLNKKGDSYSPIGQPTRILNAIDRLSNAGEIVFNNGWWVTEYVDCVLNEERLFGKN